VLRVSLLGNMGADPEVRYTAKGATMVQFRVAVNSIRNGPDGERQENTEWFRVRVSGPRTDYVQRFGKGSRVLVIGRLDIGHYQSREGDMRTSFDVWADEVQFMGQRMSASDVTDAPAESEEAPQPVAAGANGKARRASQAAEAPSASGTATATADLEDLPF
jgi:single-strand DNA-binding protein